MTQRHQRLILAIAGGLVAVGMLYGLVDKLLISPSAALDQEAVRLRGQINDVTKANKKKGQYEAHIKEATTQMMGGTETQASERLSATVQALIAKTNVVGPATPLKPAPVGVGNFYKDIGQSLKLRGSLSQVVDFLYLLDNQPFLSRIDALELTRNPSSNVVELSATFRALIPDARNKDKLTTVASMPSTEPAETEEDPHDTDRRKYDAIVSRDLFRPYVKRIVEPTPPPAPTPTPPPQETPKQPSPPPETDYRLTGLPRWSIGGEEIILADPGDGSLRHFKLNDRVGSARIVFVDYREMPKPDNPKLLSYSRMILRSGQEYWSVEIGQRLSDKRPLKPEQLPPDLRKATSRPAGSPSTQAA